MAYQVGTTMCISVIVTTAPHREAAERLAGALLEKRLVACASVGPDVTSIYRWQGKLEREDEVQVMLKTSLSRQDEAVQLLSQMHPYEVPEVLCLQVVASASYAAWVEEVTQQNCA